MKRWLLILVGIGVVFVAVYAGLLFFAEASNPVYQGKPLDQWLAISQANHKNDNAAAQEALRHYGHDAEPMLKSMLRARDTRIGNQFRGVLTRLHVRYNFTPAYVLNLWALSGCNVLGPEAAGTVPAIVEIIEGAPPLNQAYTPFFVRVYYEYPLNTLAVMGPQGIKALIHELGHTNAAVRIRAAELLGTAPGTGTPEVIDALQKCWESGNPDSLQGAAATSLKIIAQMKEQHIPASATNWIAAPSAARGIDLTSVWDMSRGTRILATSGLEQGQGTWHPEDLFGQRLSRVVSGENGSLVFDNTKPDGSWHFIEWEIPEPVTLRSFGFIASHDSADAGFQRAMRSFRLYARNDPSEKFKLIYQEELPVPYGEGFKFSSKFIFRDLETPVNARQFRAEFVQNGAGAWHGVRATQLYGFAEPLNWVMVEQALLNRDPIVRADAHRAFGKQPGVSDIQTRIPPAAFTPIAAAFFQGIVGPAKEGNSDEKNFAANSVRRSRGRSIGLRLPASAHWAIGLHLHARARARTLVYAANPGKLKVLVQGLPSPLG